MKELKQTIDLYKAYCEARKNIAREHNVAIKETEQYNPTVAHERKTDLESQQGGVAGSLRRQYNEKLNQLLESVKGIVGDAFSKSLTPDEEATLSNLEKINLSESERELYLEKFKHNPMALRRLEGMFGSGEGYKMSVATRGYDYYIALYQDFMNMAIGGMDDLDGTDPTQVDEEFGTLTADLVVEAMKKQLPQLEEEFEIFE